MMFTCKSSAAVFALIAAIWWGLVTTAAGADAPRPNVVVILIDDFGFSDLSCYGSEVQTPNIDGLASNGLRFTQFYNTARCSPTRASLMTGLYPHQAGLGFLESLVIEGSKGTQGHLRDDCVTMAEVLGDAGYFTIMTGKWHMGQNRGTPPWARGFQRSLSSAIGELYFPNQHQQRPNGVTINGKRVDLDDPVLGEDWYGPDLLTKWGLKFIDEAIAAQKPFFYYMPHSSTHFALQVPQEDIARYRGNYKRNWDQIREARHERQKELGLVDPKWELSPRPKDVFDWDKLSDEDKDHFDHIMAIYTAMIDRLDRSIGDLVAGLKERGVLDNTLILVMADNGGNAESGPRGRLEGANPGGPKSTVFLGQCWATVANTPFRRYKHFTHEGGISTPLVVHWPAGISSERNGKLVTDPSHLIDIMPTVVELSGAEYPTEFKGNTIQSMEGVSLMPAFAGKSLEREEPIFWEHEGNRAIRRGKWKLVMKFKGPWELYDMEADRTEQHDVIGEHPELANDLKSQWESWAKRSDVDPWQGELRNDWGEEIKKAGRQRGKGKNLPARKRRAGRSPAKNAD